MSFSISELFSIFGGFLGLIMLVVIVTKMEGKPLVKYSLSMFLLICSSIVLIGTIVYSGKAIYCPHIFRLDSPLHYLFGPVCFFYTLISVKSDFKFRWIQLINLLPFLINLIEFMPFFASSAAIKLEKYNALMANGALIMPMHSVLKTTAALIYLILQWFVFLKYKPGEFFMIKSNRYLISWFMIFLITQSILLVGLFINIFTGFKLFDDPYRYTKIVETFYLYITAIALLFYPALLYGNPVDTTKPKEKYLYSKLKTEEKSEILDNLINYLQSKNRPFLDPKLTLVEVASVLNIPAQQLSQVINEKTELNFNDYINTYRIKVAKEILISPDYNKFTIDAIAEKAGFNSKSPFYAAFKKITGMTPKEFAFAKLEREISK
jgi:AraC-like DNA-binding protein